MDKRISYLYRSKVGYIQLETMDSPLLDELRKYKCYTQSDKTVK